MATDRSDTLRITVESLGRIFEKRTYTIRGKTGKIEVKAKQISDTQYELEVQDNRIHMLTVRIPDDMYNALIEIAKRRNTTVSDIVRTVLADFLRKSKNE